MASRKRPYISQDDAVSMSCVENFPLFSSYCLWHEYFYYIVSSWYCDEDDDVKFFLPFFSENDWLLERSWWEPIGGHYLMSVRIIRHTGAQDDGISISLVKVWLIHKHEHHHKNLIFSVSTFDDDGLVTTKRFFSCPGRERGCKAPKSDAIACVR